MSKINTPILITRNLDEVTVRLKNKECTAKYHFGKVLRNKFKELQARYSDQELNHMQEKIKHLIKTHSPEYDEATGRVPIKTHLSPELTPAEQEEARQLLLSEQNILQQIFSNSKIL